MKLVSKVLLINIGAAFVVALLFSLSSGGSLNGQNFALSFGLTCLGIGILDLFVWLILLMIGRDNVELASGFLLSGGVLLLIGFAVCGGSFSLSR